MKKLTWQKLYSSTDLYSSTLKLYSKSLFNRGKGLTQSHDEQTLFDFATHTNKNINQLAKRLNTKEFRFQPTQANHFNFNGKERTIYLAPWEDRIIDTYLYDALSSHFDYYFTPHTYAYRSKGFGVDACQNSIKKYLSNNKELYVLKRDVSNYFPSIDKNILLEKLKDVVEESDYLYKLLEQRINFTYVEKGSDEAQTTETGVPFGCPIACFFANYYLDEMDKFFHDKLNIKFKNLKYFRYADDILILSTEESDIRMAEEAFVYFLEKLNLKSKPKAHLNLFLTTDKSKEVEGFETVDRFKHLGLQFRADGNIGLSRDKTRKIQNLVKRRIKKTRFKKDATQDEKIEKCIKLANEALESTIRSVAIVDYYLKHTTDEKQLKLLDRWVAETIIAKVLNRGYKKGNFAKIPYKKLRDMGLVSLVHRRRLLIHGHIDSNFFQMRNDSIKNNYKKRRRRRKPTPA